jgi:hypothetical protein
VNEALVLVVLLWAVLLIPSALRSRSSGSPHVTVGGFARAMDVLKTSPSSPGSSPGSGSDAGRQLLVPGDASRIVAHQRPPARSRAAEGDDSAPPTPGSATREDPIVAARRVWFLRLVGGTVGSLLLAVAVGGALLWTVALTALASTAGYVALLRRWKIQRDEVKDVVRELEVPPSEDGQPVEVAAGGERDGVAVRLRRWNG